MKKLRVLVLLNKYFVPPKNAEDFKKIDLDKAIWNTAHHVISTLKGLQHEVYVLGVEGDLLNIKNICDQFKPQIIFNLLEEFDGHSVLDHNVVSFLELMKWPYTGCNSKGLMLARDKSLSKKILNYHDIKTPDFKVAYKKQKFIRPKELAFPLIVKSLTEEGSAGICQNSIVTNDLKLQERIEFIHESISAQAIVESYVEGDDIYVSMIGRKQLKIFPILELEFKDAPNHIHKIATSRVKWSPEYRKKYQIDVKFTERLDKDSKNKVEELSKKIYRVLELSGYARIDLRITKENEIYFLEANPNPDIACDEEFAISAKKANISYPLLLEKIITLGLNKSIFFCA